MTVWAKIYANVAKGDEIGLFRNKNLHGDLHSKKEFVQYSIVKMGVRARKMRNEATLRNIYSFGAARPSTGFWARNLYFCWFLARKTVEKCIIL